MQVVIDIPDRIYKISQNRTLNITDNEILEKALRNGTPLPKGHGRLGDLDALEEEIENHSKGAFAMTVEFLVKDTPTIIEADKGDTE